MRFNYFFHNLFCCINEFQTGPGFYDSKSSLFKNVLASRARLALNSRSSSSTESHSTSVSTANRRAAEELSLAMQQWHAERSRLIGKTRMLVGLCSCWFELS